MNFKYKVYLPLIVVFLIIIILFVVLSPRESPNVASDINCFAFDVFSDKNYLVPYSLFLLNYIGIDFNSDPEILKNITFEVVAASPANELDPLFDADAVNAMLTTHKDVAPSQVCVYSVNLVPKVDLMTPLKQTPANEKALSMYWLVHVTAPEPKILDSLILEHFG